MKLFELLDEIKIGDEIYQELKISEDIEEDVDSLEEGTRFVRINRRLNKIHDRLSSKVGDMKELKSIVRNIGRTSNVFEHAEDLFWKGLNPSQAQARAKMISVKKNFEKILSELLDRDVKRMISEAGAIVLIGEALGSIIHGAERLQKVAKTNTAASVQKRLVPSYLKFESNLEQKLLRKAEDGGFEPQIREDMED
jgi:hypothetical protein